MKRITVIIAAFIFILSAFIISSSAVENEISVTLDGFEVHFDVPGRIIETRTMVPVRKIFEALGAEIEWDAGTKTVTSHYGDDTVSLTIGEKELYKNGEIIYEMDSVPVIVEEAGESRTLVPLRAVAEALGYEVDWDGETATAIITSISDDTVLVADGFPIDFETYYYFVVNTLVNSDLIPDDFADDAVLDEFKSNVIDNIASFYSPLKLFAKAGYSPYDTEAISTVDSAFDEYKNYYGDDFDRILSESGMTEKVFKNVLCYTLFENTFLTELRSTYSNVSSAAKAEAIMSDDTVIRATHILVSDKETADMIVSSAKDADNEKFFALISEFGIDPGVADNTDGYYFSHGQMIAAFDEAAFSLDENETSDVIESDLGYHIIRRLPKDADYVAEYADEIFDNILIGNYYTTVAEYKTEIMGNIKYFDRYNKVDTYSDIILPFNSLTVVEDSNLTGIPAESTDEIYIDGVPEDDVDESTGDTVSDESDASNIKKFASLM